MFRWARVWSAVGVGILLLAQPVWPAGDSAPGKQIHQSIDKILAILNDAQLKGEQKKNARREKLKAVIYERFDFTEMAKRSLGAEWRRRTPEEQKEFVRLFTALLEDAYLDKIESYGGEKVLYQKERQEDNYAEVDTKIVDKTGQEYSVDYRLHKVNGDWKVYDVVIEDVSLVNNYRAQFSRVLARSSYEELLERMRQKTFSAPEKKANRAATPQPKIRNISRKDAKAAKKIVIRTWRSSRLGGRNLRV